MLSLVAAAPASAQTTIWSATMSVGNGGAGCTPTLNPCSSALSDDDFTYGGEDYEITSFVTLNGLLYFSLDKAIPPGLVVRIGTSEFAIANATFDNNGQRAQWSTSINLGSGADRTVSLSLVKPATPTFTEYSVTLTADNLRPTEGSMVTLTATLNPAAPADGATLHFIKAMGTAISPGDFTLSPPGGGSAVTADISINQGETTFTATLKVIRDTEAEGDETIVIGVGSRSSLTLTNRPRLTLTIPANAGRTTTTPTPDPPSPPTPTPPTGGGPPPAAPSDPDPSSLCGETDREDLESFYEASGGENWDEKENWNSDKPLGEWHGVETDEDGEVVSLLLPDNNLSGNMLTEQLLCLRELVELALWGNELLGEVPDKFTLPVERAVLRDIAEMLNINPEWFEDYGDPYDFEYWHTGVTTDDGRVTELDFTGEGITGEIPQSVFELQRLEEISTGCGVTLEGEAPEGVRVIMPDDCETEASGDGGCALGSGDSSVFGLFLVTLLVFGVLGRTRARG